MTCQFQHVQSVLITGASGSFGQAFTRHLLTNNLAERICIYSRGEHRQADMRKSFNDDDRLRFFIGDVRDKVRLRRAMEGVEVVVHAAALKRIEAVQYNVLEAVKTNIDGTANVVECAIDAGVRRSVLLSTDKACEPTTIYGYTKAVAEAIFLNAASYVGDKVSRFAVTRYGNVAGSQGSVIPLWQQLKAAGITTVPVTDPDCTRFWMTLAEAVDLVRLAIKHGDNGSNLFTPLSLPAYRLGDLAEAMGLQMRIMGLRNDEKLHESMRPGEPSNQARRLTIEEIKCRIETL